MIGILGERLIDGCIIAKKAAFWFGCVHNFMREQSAITLEYGAIEKSTRE